MLAPVWPSSFPNTRYTPTRPSPLSPRSANACFRPLFGTMSKPPSEPQKPFEKRAVKPNPVLKTRDEQRERRRELFMKKVERGRDEKRWEGRSDQILRSDYLAQQRRWEAERAMSAPEPFPDYQEEEEDQEDLDNSLSFDIDAQRRSHTSAFHARTPRLQPQLWRTHSNEDAEVDAVARMEEAELQELIALADEPLLDQMPDIPSSPTRYGSDEEDYDDIFMEVILSSQGARHSDHKQEDDSMDLSNG